MQYELVSNWNLCAYLLYRGFPHFGGEMTVSGSACMVFENTPELRLAAEDFKRSEYLKCNERFKKTVKPLMDELKATRN